MVIVKIIGGLGNQMFQYAYAKALQQKGHEVKIDITAFETYKLHGGFQLDKYTIDLKVSSKEENRKFYNNSNFFKILKKLGFDFSKTIKEKNLLFDGNFLKIEDNSYLDGYFQSEKYFKNIRDILLEQFILKDEMSNYAKEISHMILEIAYSVSLHVRRGDFTNSTNVNIHGICSLDYYQKAINMLNDRSSNMTYFIFSDDIAWVKKNLKIENAIYLDSKGKRIPHEDMYLMSLCNHNIIANSSFSWWGAWLNKNEEKIVIAPNRWFADDDMQKQSKDIVSQSWVKI